LGFDRNASDEWNVRPVRDLIFRRSSDPLTEAMPSEMPEAKASIEILVNTSLVLRSKVPKVFSEFP
jgi:hypothetical protein